VCVRQVAHSQKYYILKSTLNMEFYRVNGAFALSVISKKSALRGIPPGALRGYFRGSKKWLRHGSDPRKCEEGMPVHLLHALPLSRQSEQGCLDRLRRWGLAQ